MNSENSTPALVRRALTVTIPVMCGYLFMGIAFGLLLQDAGYSFIWALFMSVVIYAGTMQYMAIPFLVAQADLLTVAITTLLVHFRHFVYGLSFIQRFKPMGKRKYYMMFGMTDETYALLCAEKAPSRESEEKFFFLVALFDHLYWIIGCTAGALAGQFLTINTKGIDFAMTALFIVICVDQWRAAKSKLPTVIGACAAVISLAGSKLLGIDNMLIPAIVMIIVCFFALRSKLEPLLLEGQAEGAEG
ncbi:AzlC family ABC transporter permease [Intestinibacillus massiliensis]|uniref:AzlC family ABC transporter permease n=1 Tax=Intestinibacillus massiliensis TaxID=1871029 RepID=UPI001F387ECA|nr:AzlC family ABC transporter permease [Intestinibacillus massiliensis]